MLLVSLCNILPPDFALGLYDFETNRLRWVDLSKLGSRIYGANGIMVAEDKIWFLAQTGNWQSAIISLDSNLQNAKLYPLKETSDAHAFIKTDEGSFLVTDTRKNRVNKVDILDDGSVKEIEFWRADKSDIDAIHLNSIAKWDDRIFVTIFGQKDKLWKLAKGGLIIDILNNEVLAHDLVHPHSLTNIDGTLCWVESANSTICRYSKHTGVERIAVLHGYLRGITSYNNHLYVGISAARVESRSTGTRNATPNNERDTHSWICKLDTVNNTTRENIFTAHGSEIYDLMPVEGLPEISEEDNQRSIIERIKGHERHFFQTKVFLQKRIELLEKKDPLK